MNNIQSIILTIFEQKQEYDKQYNRLMSNFIMKANELVILSEDLYQIEHTIRLNQISLKDYILNSEICCLLKKQNIHNYSISDLKEYMKKYENQNTSDITSYKFALELYETLEEIKQIEDSKINYEMTKMSTILENINSIKNFSKDKYQDLYNNLLNQIKIKYLDNHIIDDRTNNYMIQILNDIFYFYLNGNKAIPLKIE